MNAEPIQMAEGDGMARSCGPAPEVSIVIPCRNEAAFIEECLQSILSSDCGESYELIVADGRSTDGTPEIIRRLAAQEARIRLLDNPRCSAPAGLNIALRAARGKVIVRVDAHAKYPANYVKELLRWLRASGADNVGGVLRTVAARQSPECRAIAAAQASRFGVGNAHFRVGAKEPKWVDTVPFGCYRRNVFDRIGYFDEELIRNQDDEFNLRLIARGGRVLLVPSIVCDYYARDSLSKLWRMYYQYGLFKPLASKKLGRIGSWRQLVPGGLTLTLGMTAALSAIAPVMRGCFTAVLGAYLLADVAAVGVMGVTEGARAAAWGMLVFPTLHFSYGIGYLIGAWRLIQGKPIARDAQELPLSR